MTAAQRRKLDSFGRELVRAHNKINELIDDKRRSCRAKSEFKKFLIFLKNYEKKAQDIDTKQGNNARSITCEQNKNAYCSEDFVKEIIEYFENTVKAEALGIVSSPQSLYSSRLSQRPGSMESLSHAGNHVKKYSVSKKWMLNWSWKTQK